MATAMPQIQVEFQNYYGSWTDVSDYLMTEAGVSVRRGRGTRYDTSGPGTCSFTLDNFTGNFTPGNTSGAYYAYGWPVKNQQVRVTVDTVRVFTGFVDSWSVSVSSDGQCLAQVTASDALKFLNQNPLASFGVERAKQVIDTSGVVYPCAADIGADTSGQWQAWRDTSAGLLTISTVSGSGAWEFVSDAPAFGSGSFHGIPDSSGFGVGLGVPKTVDIGTGGTAFGVFRINPAATGFATLFFVSGSSTAYNAWLYVEPVVGNAILSLVSYPSGTVYTITSSVTKLNDDAWHTFALVFASTGKLATLYVDGASVGSVSSGTAWALSPTGRSNVFGITKAGGSAIDGYLSTIGVTSEVLTAAKVSDLHDAVMTGDKGDTIATRCTNYLDFLYPSGSPTISTANVSGMTLAGQATNGKAPLAAINEIADAERGVVYVDRLGAFKFRGSTARTAAYSLTFDALADLDGSAECSLITDDSLFANRIVASGPVGSYTAENSGSIATLGIVSESWTCIADSLATPTGNRLTDRLADTPRIGQITVDLMTASSVSTSSTLQLVPLDCVRLTNLPTQLGAATRDAIVEGYSLTASVNTYTVTLDLSPTG